MDRMRVFCSWSGGKDSCLAYYKAKQEGYEVIYLLTMLTTTGRYSRSHRLSKEILMAQAEAVGVRVSHRCASWNTYEREFNKALNFFKREGLKAGVFGDLDLEQHRKWVESICKNSQLGSVFPLWKQGREDILWQLIDAGFEAVVVRVKNSVLDHAWLGRRIDADFVYAMKKAGIDICGENGEYHTLCC